MEQRLVPQFVDASELDHDVGQLLNLVRVVEDQLVNLARSWMNGGPLGAGQELC